MSAQFDGTFGAGFTPAEMAVAYALAAECVGDPSAKGQDFQRPERLRAATTSISARLRRDGYGTEVRTWSTGANAYVIMFPAATARMAAQIAQAIRAGNSYVRSPLDETVGVVVVAGQPEVRRDLLPINRRIMGLVG